MLKISELILADASVLILLDNADLWFILKKLFGNIYVTPEVQEEFGLELPEWIQIYQYKDITLFQNIHEIVGKGEASLITVALEQENKSEVLLLLDDLKARKLAEKFQLNLTGILGVLLVAKESTIIDNVKPYTELLIKVGMRVAPKLLEKVL